MRDGVVAERYARAFFQAARRADAGEKARQDFRRFGRILRTDEKLSRALNHPLLPLAEKKRRLAQAMGKNQFAFFDGFLELVLVKKRLPLLPRIAALFEEMADEANRVRRVQLKSAVPLNADQIHDLEQRFRRAWNTPVTVETSVDENLIGGLVMRVGDRVWDRSLRGQLRRMREKLLEPVNV